MPPNRNDIVEEQVLQQTPTMSFGQNIQPDFVNHLASSPPEFLQENGYRGDGGPRYGPRGAAPGTTRISMFKESERLKTFEGWPVQFLSPKQMTSAGFYFLKNQDIVRCPFCNVEVGHWEQGDDPLKDHKRWSPTCKFVRNIASCGNVPLEQGEEASGSSSDEGYDTCGIFGIKPDPEKGVPSLEKLKVQRTRPPSFPNYATPDSRLRSFESWPVSLKLKPKMLSEAGFFYTGKGDQTLCFQCGGGLKDWEETDEPWVEHARWFSKCSFVVMMKGQSFIDEVSGEKTREELERKLSASTGDLDKIRTDNPEKKQEHVESEKNELASRAKDVEKSPSDENEARICKICYGAEMGVAFLPCGHVVACPQCAATLSKCASCREPISAFVRIYLS